jgi:hypothetical protein
MVSLVWLGVLATFVTMSYVLARPLTSTTWMYVLGGAIAVPIITSFVFRGAPEPSIAQTLYGDDPKK